jgi:uncharacterized Ntn-hydrolase superfamily protein
VTLSLVAGGDDGVFGMVIASSSPAVASRCIHLRPGVGAVASQNVTNPGLGPIALDALESGNSPKAALDAALATDAHPEFRQLTAVDRFGRIAVRSGSRALGLFGSTPGNACIAAGNMLASDAVLPGMVEGFERASGALEERLLAGLQLAVDRGGEEGPLRSAGLAVVESASWRVTDLRVDDHDDPVGELTRLLSLWLPQKRDYLVRAIDPSSAPSYGVPGNL